MNSETTLPSQFQIWWLAIRPRTLPAAAAGVAAIFSAIAYTGGPFPLGYYGLGDLFVILCFGLACVAGTYFVHAGLFLLGMLLAG